MALRFQQKLTLPLPAGPLVDRPELVRQLNEAIATKRVIALTAPAGWGKTTVLTQWAGQASVPVVWYSLDTADVDPRTFLDYLLHSVAGFAPGTEALAAQLASSPAESLLQVYHSTALAVAAAPRPFALVFDDFHVIRDDPAAALPGSALILGLLASLAEYAPNCHLVFASRTVPAFHGMVRLLAQQRAAVFDYTTLQFSPADVQQLAGLTASLMLSDEQATELAQRFSGWVAGLVLSLNQAVPPEQREDSHPVDLGTDTAPVYAFFAEQIIAPLDPTIQRFLEETSVLEDLSAQRCNTLRGTSDAAAHIDEIRRHGLFVASRAGWLSYHSLFREFLRSRLARDPQRYRELFRRAGDLYRIQDELERAIECYLEAGAEQQAMALLLDAVPRFRQRSHQTTLLACFERLSQVRSDRRHTLAPIEEPRREAGLLPPRLLLAQARVLSDLALWERAYLAVELAEAVGDDQICREARIQYAELCCLRGLHHEAYRTLCDLNIDQAPPATQLDYYATFGRALILQGDIPSAIRALEQAHALSSRVPATADDPTQIAGLADMLGWAYGVQGDQSLSLRYLKRADACWQASGNSGRRTMTLNNLAMVAMEQGRYSEARSALKTGVRLAQQTNRYREETILHCTLGDLNLLEASLDASIASFTEAHRLAVCHDVPSSVAIAASGALWAAVLRQELALAQAWLDVVSTCDPSLQEVHARVALGHAFLLWSQPRAASTNVAALADTATAHEHALGRFERTALAALRAALSLRSANWTRATADWEAAVQYAAGLPEQTLLLLVAPLRELFEAAAAHGSTLAERLLSLSRRPVARRWRITALGAFSCTVDGEPIELSPLHRALLVRLLDAGPEGIPVEQLWEDIWGDDQISMPALRQALYRIRAAAGIDLGTRDGNCAIRSGWETLDYDVRAFEQALDRPLGRESVQTAAAFYRGAFLISAPLSAAIWADRRRSYLQQRYLDALERLAEVIETESPAQAIQYYQHVLQIDGCREHTAARLMQLAARFGQRSLVNTTFEHLRSALKLLGAVPEPSTTALYRQLN